MQLQLQQLQSQPPHAPFFNRSDQVRPTSRAEVSPHLHCPFFFIITVVVIIIVAVVGGGRGAGGGAAVPYIYFLLFVNY